MTVFTYVIWWKARVKLSPSLKVELVCVLWLTALRNGHVSIIVRDSECAMCHGHELRGTYSQLEEFLNKEIDSF